jgi:putative transcriptional regulator
MINRLRELRAERGWAQGELAGRLGVSRQTINAIETERYDPSLPLAFKIARLFSTTRRVGLALVLAGAPLLQFIVPGASWIRTSAAVAAGLMLVFFPREDVHDERVQELKLRAVSTAFSVSFTLTLVINWFLNRDFDVTRDFAGPTMTLRSISAFDLIIVTMATALALFNYWRWQDGGHDGGRRAAA